MIDLEEYLSNEGFAVAGGRFAYARGVDGLRTCVEHFSRKETPTPGKEYRIHVDVHTPEELDEILAHHALWETDCPNIMVDVRACPPLKLDVFNEKRLEHMRYALARTLRKDDEGKTPIKRLLEHQAVDAAADQRIAAEQKRAQDECTGAIEKTRQLYDAKWPTLTFLERQRILKEITQSGGNPGNRRLRAAYLQPYCENEY